MSARRIAIIATAVVGIAALVGAVAYFMPIFKVQNFSIRGQHNTSAEDIQSATHISIGANLMRIDARLPHTASHNSRGWIRRR